jgi:hypothetical protein
MRLILTGWLTGGIMIMLGEWFTFDEVLGIEISPTLNAGPAFIEWLFSIMLVVGSVLILLSTMRWRNKSTSWKFELFAWPLLISSWLIYVITGLLLPHPVIFPVILAVGYVAASTFRLTEVLRSIKVTRKHVEIMKSGGQANV